MIHSLKRILTSLGVMAASMSLLTACHTMQGGEGQPAPEAQPAAVNTMPPPAPVMKPCCKHKKKMHHHKKKMVKKKVSTTAENEQGQQNSTDENSNPANNPGTDANTSSN